MNPFKTIIPGLFALLLLGACTQKTGNNAEVFRYTNSVDIAYGSDICSFSDEVISTVRYGGRMTLNNGKVHKFMSVECTAGYYLSMDDNSRITKIEIVDFAHGQKYMPVEELVFLQSSLRPSPSGLSLTAIDASNEKMKAYIYDAYPGDFYTWNEVLEIVEKEWGLTAGTSKTAMK
ncbi:MAG: hypothetical protein WEA56_12635 [Balneolaceae bacterium]